MSVSVIGRDRKDEAALTRGLAGRRGNKAEGISRARVYEQLHASVFFFGTRAIDIKAFDCKWLM